MISYKDAGVDIDAGNAFVKAISALVAKTLSPNAKKDFGSFAGGFSLPKEFGSGVLFASTDGVGTKLTIAKQAQKFDTIGIDLVAMCVNDLICSFASPLFFLDYYACAKLDINEARSVVEGIANGCLMAECSLIGGETAEMPGLYMEKDFDLAGFSVGIAHEEDLQKPKTIEVGDMVVGLRSSGLHSNGYSLARKVLFEHLKLDLETKLFDEPLFETLLRPTKIYVKQYKKIKPKIKALAHITGGGIVENFSRVLDGFGAKLDKTSIKPMNIFDFLSKYVTQDEMYRTFNMGVGMIVVCSPDETQSVVDATNGFVMGEITKSGVVLD